RRRRSGAPRRRRRRASTTSAAPDASHTGREQTRSRRIRRLPYRHVVLDQLPGLVALGLVVWVVRLVREGHLEIPLGRGEAVPGHVRQAGHEGVAALRRGADLLLLVLLHLLLARLDEAELLLPLGAADVRQVLGALHVVAQAEVGLVAALVCPSDRFLQVGVRQLVEAVGMVGPRLSVVGGLDLAGARGLADLEDL